MGMRIAIGAVGRVRAGPGRDLVARYLDRARATGRRCSLIGFEVTEVAESRAPDAATRRREEADKLNAAISGDARRVILDGRGETLTSEKFAARIEAWRDAGTPALAFVIGGPDGLDSRFRSEADLVLSLSSMTWPHQLVRLMLAEQLYRATAILTGHPYHRGD